MGNLIKEKKYIKFLYKNKKINFLGYLIYTGLNAGTGGRIKIAYKKLKLKKTPKGDFLFYLNNKKGKTLDDEIPKIIINI